MSADHGLIVPPCARSERDGNDDDADIYKAIGELEKKVQQLGYNQRAIEAKLDHIAARVDAANANLTKVMNSVGWWPAGDADTAEQTWPSNPHWHHGPEPDVCTLNESWPEAWRRSDADEIASLRSQ